MDASGVAKLAKGADRRFSGLAWEITDFVLTFVLLSASVLTLLPYYYDYPFCDPAATQYSAACNELPIWPRKLVYCDRTLYFLIYCLYLTLAMRSYWSNANFLDDFLPLCSQKTCNGR